MKFSKEYLLSIALTVGSVLKLFGIEIENGAIEGIVAGIMAILIAVARFKKGDINVLGAKNA